MATPSFCTTANIIACAYIKHVVDAYHMYQFHWIYIIGYGSKEDYYSLLGVPRNASQKEIKKAYYEVSID